MILPLLAPRAEAHTAGLSYASFARGELVLTFAQREAVTRPPALSLTTPDGPCTLGAWATETVPGDTVSFVAPVDCPEGPVEYAAPFLHDLAPGHRHAVVAGDHTAVMHAGLPVTRIGDAASWGAVPGAVLDGLTGAQRPAVPAVLTLVVVALILAVSRTRRASRATHHA